MRALNPLSPALLTPWAFLIGGCVTVSSGPDRGFDPSAEAASILSLYRIPENYGPGQEAARNNFIDARMYAIDLNYSLYFEKLLKEKQTGNAALDAGLLGLTAATTVTPGAAAKSALGAASAALAGAKTDIDQDIYMSSTLQILMNTMESQRLAIRNRIDANKNLSLATYSAWRALTDTDDYYRAGTLAGALQSLTASSGKNAANQKDLQNGTTAAGEAVAGAKAAPSGAKPVTSLQAPVSTLPK